MQQGCRVSGYGRRICPQTAHLQQGALHTWELPEADLKTGPFYGHTPLELDIAELEEYLYHLILKDSDRLCSFKHLVYGLHRLYKLFGKEDLQLALPKISRPNKLQAALSKQEVKSLLKTAVHLREKVMFALTYYTGFALMNSPIIWSAT